MSPRYEKLRIFFEEAGLDRTLEILSNVAGREPLLDVAVSLLVDPRPEVIDDLHRALEYVPERMNARILAMQLARNDHDMVLYEYVGVVAYVAHSMAEQDPDLSGEVFKVISRHQEDSFTNSVDWTTTLLSKMKPTLEGLRAAFGYVDALLLSYGKDEKAYTLAKQAMFQACKIATKGGFWDELAPAMHFAMGRYRSKSSPLIDEYVHAVLDSQERENAPTWLKLCLISGRDAGAIPFDQGEQLFYRLRDLGVGDQYAAGPLYASALDVEPKLLLHWAMGKSVSKSRGWGMLNEETCAIFVQDVVDKVSAEAIEREDQDLLRRCSTSLLAALGNTIVRDMTTYGKANPSWLYPSLEILLAHADITAAVEAVDEVPGIYLQDYILRHHPEFGSLVTDKGATRTMIEGLEL